MSVVGIDIGNDKSVVAVARNRIIEVLQNDTGNRRTASLVAFAGKQRVLGDAAVLQWPQNHRNTLQHMKSMLGRKFSDPELKDEMSHSTNRIVATPKGTVGYEVDYNDSTMIIPVEHAMASLLAKMRSVAEAGLNGARVSDCVLACPPDWHQAQRRAYLDAAHAAGLNVLRLMNEPTAIALNYGILRPMGEKEERRVLFLDVGYTVTSACIGKFTAAGLDIVAAACDRNLAARTYDYELIKMMHTFILQKYKMDVASKPNAYAKLLRECRRVKLLLSANQKVAFNVEYMMNDTDVKTMVDRNEVDAVCEKAIVPRMRRLLDSLLQQANLKKEELAALEIVGGGSRIPLIGRVVQEWFGRDISRTCDSDESVVRGCTWMCAMLSPTFRVKKYELRDINYYSIDVAWGPVPRDPSAPFVPEDQSELFKVRDPLPNVKMISFKNRSEPFMLVARYARPELLPPAVDPVIGRFVVNHAAPLASVQPVAPPKIKIKVKIDLHSMLVLSSAEVLTEVVESAPAPAPAPASASASPSVPGPGPAPASASPQSTGASTPSEMQDEDGGAPKAGKMEDERAPNQMEDDTAAETPASAAPAGGSDAAAPAAGTTTTTPSAPKTKVLRQALTVQSHFTSGMSEAELNSMIELEVRMVGQDRSIEETAARKNELESYALNMRNAVQEELRDYVRDDVRDSFVRTLNDVESWLYDAGADAQKSEYVARLESVKKVGDPIKRRRVEEEMRPEQVAALKSVIGKYSSLALSQDEKFSHIEQVERDKVVKECNTVDQWLAQALGRQDRLKRHEDPAFTCQELEAKRQQLDAFASAIMGKPKPPPPPPKPAPAPAPAPAGDGKPQAQPAPDAAAPQAQPPQPNGAPAGSSKMDTAEN